MFFHALAFARSRGRCWKPRQEAEAFNISQGTWQMLMHWKTMFDCYYFIKAENICYISRYFLHYFVSPFHRCLVNAISSDCARSRARQYTSRDGSNSVALVQAYWKLCSCALFNSVWIVSLIHGFSPAVNKVQHCFLCNKTYYCIKSSVARYLQPRINRRKAVY